jgi:hypothetical protein
LVNSIIDLIKSSEDEIGISSSGGRGGRRRATPTFFGDAGIRDALETNALEQLALVAAVTRLDAMQAGGRAESDVGAIQRAVAVAAVTSALGWALAEGLRRDAEAVRTYDLTLGANPGDPVARRTCRPSSARAYSAGRINDATRAHGTSSAIRSATRATRPPTVACSALACS